MVIVVIMLFIYDQPHQISTFPALMAKLVRRVTSNDEIVGSNPARGIVFDN